MESCEVDQSDGLSSDIGGFLSSSCMETDEKSDPFNSDNGLGFSEDSSRFDSECILSSSLADSVSMQQTTTCDSSVPSFVSGDSLGSCSTLTGGSLLLYDLPGTSMQKPTNPVMQLNSSNVVLVGGSESKAADQKFDFLPPVQLLTPSVSHSQSHPVVIGNSNAASFVKSVLKDAAVLPSTSCSTFMPAKEMVSMPPVMLLNSTFPIPLSVLQSASGIGSTPLLIQLPTGVKVSGTPDPQQPPYSLNNLISTEASASIAPVSAMNSVSMDSLTPDCGGVLTSSCGSVPSSSMLPITGCVSSPLLTPMSTPIDCMSASSASLHSATYTTTRTESDATNNNIINNRDNNNDNNNNSNNNNSNNTTDNMDTVSGMNICEPSTSSCSTPQLTQTQTLTKAPSHPIVISCVRPDNRGNKGMQQILEHFLQQNKANSLLATANMDNKQPVNLPLQLTNMVDMGSAGASTSASTDAKPQVISVADLDSSSSSSTFTVPSLGTKSGSVVFILRRTGSQTSTPSASITPSDVTSSSSLGDRNTTAALSVSCSNTKQDEIDGSVTSNVDSSMLTSDNIRSLENTMLQNIASSNSNTVFDSTASSDNTMLDSTSASGSTMLENITSSDNSTLDKTSLLDSTLPKVSLPEQSTITGQTGLPTTVVNTTSTGESNNTPLSALTPSTFTLNNTDSTNIQYQWIQIQVPSTNNITGQSTETNSEGTSSEDVQKLIPSTVNEKLASDVCHPIIICIVQEDGLMKRVNINTGDMSGNLEMKDVTAMSAATQDSGGTSTAPDSLKASSAPSSVETDINSAATKSETKSPPHPHPSTSTSSPGQESSSSPQTGSESGSPPAGSKKSPVHSKDRQYACDLCTAVFSRLGNFTRHRKIHTLNLKEDKHFKCPYCERPFLQRCDMNRHIAVHTNQYPFRCQTCDKGYIRKSDLVVHERFHSKNRAFKCETCGRSFYQSGDLSRHKRFVHMEQSQLSCSHCQRKYASEVTLIRHMKTAHNDILLQSMSQQTQQQ